MRQRLQQCVSLADWSDNELRRRLALKLEADQPEVEALVVDDTGAPKKGEHSVGVARQYSYRRRGLAAASDARPRASLEKPADSDGADGMKQIARKRCDPVVNARMAPKMRSANAGEE
ncbi:transposase [Myxococcus xanthus]|uniref:transposase n=1 Tax=Myxococcus xanthus TaxID=34 RepID=UPI001375F12C